jgi:hypothetical protein
MRIFQKMYNQERLRRTKYFKTELEYFSRKCHYYDSYYERRSNIVLFQNGSYMNESHIQS